MGIPAHAKLPSRPSLTLRLFSHYLTAHRSPLTAHPRPPHAHNPRPLGLHLRLLPGGLRRTRLPAPHPHAPPHPRGPRLGLHRRRQNRISRLLPPPQTPPPPRRFARRRQHPRLILDHRPTRRPHPQHGGPLHPPRRRRPRLRDRGRADPARNHDR